MIHSIEEIIKSVKTEFPLIFGAKDLVSTADFYNGYNVVAEHSIRATNPPLKSETHKHQWTLMGAAIGLIALVLFKVGKIKIAEAVINVDRQVVTWYAVFVSALLLTFLLRAALDLKRASLTLKKDSEKLTALSDTVEMAFAVRNIQHYYWLELFHQIGERYTVYLDATASAPEAIKALNVDMRIINLDIKTLKEVSEFHSQIEGHEAFITSLVKDLDKDVARFKDKVDAYNHSLKNEALDVRVSDWKHFSHIEELFDRHLKPWFDAREALTDAVLDAVLDKGAMRESQMLDAQLKLLRKAKIIRRMYSLSEILLPSILALASVIYAVESIW